MNLIGAIFKHIKANRWQYLLISIIFIAGLISGSYRVHDLEASVRSHLLYLIDNYLRGSSQGDLAGGRLLFYAFLNQAKTIVLVWFLGLTVIGMPLILGICFLKGFSLGFTIGFLVQERAGEGILISILAILPQNLLYIPLLIVWSVTAIKFTIFITGGRHSNTLSLGRALAAFTGQMLILLLVVLAGALIEAYFSPWFIQIFV
ncbi:MAG: stage II sporulation protein M [Syntrophomonadaceae bacterium]|nr:stage II sporulation protein M [Syntrophomonadaceae bacterium]